MSLNISELVTIGQALLVNAQRMIPFLKQRVQPVQNAGVTEVSILENNPLAFDNGFNKD